jgi:putative nucleotidyltransferase with HDIG domain
MPKMSGAELLQKVVELYPHIIRIILSGHSDQEMILKATRTAHQFITKPCKPEVIVQKIRKAIDLRKSLHSEELASLVNGVKNLPAIPALYLKLEHELKSNGASIKAIGKIISEDMTMSAKILQLVNSAFFGLRYNISDPVQAVSLLGINVVKSLVLYIKIFSDSMQINSEYISIDDTSRHSLLVAQAAEKIYLAETNDKLLSKEAFVAGMLHDIGKLIIIQVPNYDKLISVEINTNGCSLEEAEYKCFGVSHAEVGAYLLGIWNIPDHLVEAVAFHHNKFDDNMVSIANVVRYSNYYINMNSVKENKVPEKLLEIPFTKWKELLDEICN